MPQFESLRRTATATFTPTAVAYSAGDIMEGAKEFLAIGPAGASVMITSVSLEVDHTALVASEATYTLHLYNVTPPSAPADNAAWDLPSGDRASYLGLIALGTPVDLGSTLYVETNSVNKQIKLSGSSVFGLLVTVAGITPTAAARKVTLHTICD